MSHITLQGSDGVNTFNIKFDLVGMQREGDGTYLLPCEISAQAKLQLAPDASDGAKEFFETMGTENVAVGLQIFARITPKPIADETKESRQNVEIISETQTGIYGLPTDNPSETENVAPENVPIFGGC